MLTAILAIFLAAMLAPALNRLFPAWSHWLLALVPTQPELASLIRSVRLEGEDDHLTRMTLEETNGDQSTLDFTRTP